MGVGGEGLRNGILSVLKKTQLMNFQLLIKNNVEFNDVIKKKSCGISRALGFRAENFLFV